MPWNFTGSCSAKLLFVENIGNLVCPAEFTIGEHIKVLVCTVTDGADKPYKYPLAFEKGGRRAAEQNGSDALRDFDLDYFTRGVHALNPDAPIFPVSAKTGEGYDRFYEWLRTRLYAARDAGDRRGGAGRRLSAFVARLARGYGLTGWVRNQGGQVRVAVYGADTLRASSGRSARRRASANQPHREAGCPDGTASRWETAPSAFVIGPSAGADGSRDADAGYRRMRRLPPRTG